MMKVLEQAIEKVKKLPEDRQAYAAEVLEQIAASSDGVFEIPEEHLTGVLEGLEQAKRGDFASDEDMARLWKKAGL
jgi:predicted transcriptional regulator